MRFFLKAGLLGFFFFFTFLGMSVSAQAEETAQEDTKMVTVADVNVTDVVVEEKDGALSGTFSLQGKMGQQNDIVYGIIVVDKDSIVYDIKSLGRDISVQEGEIKSLTFQYVFPSYLSGDLRILLRAETNGGLALGTQNLVEKNFGTKKEESLQCVSKDEAEVFSCTSEKGGEIETIYYAGSVFGKEQRGEKKVISSGDPVDIKPNLKPGQYTVVVRDIQNGVLVTLPVRVAGSFGALQSVAIQKGESEGTLSGAVVALASPSKGASIEVKIFSEKNDSCGETTVAVEGGVAEFQMTAPRCTTGTVKVVLKGADGKELDSLTQPFSVNRVQPVAEVFQEKEVVAKKSEMNISGTGVFFGLLVLGVLVAVFFRGRYLVRKQRGLVKGIILVLVGFAPFFLVSQAHALTMSESSWGNHTCGPCEVAGTVFATISTNKSQYAPGESMSITASANLSKDSGLASDEGITFSLRYDTNSGSTAVFDSPFTVPGSLLVGANNVPSASIPNSYNGNIAPTAPGSNGSHSLALRLTVQSIFSGSAYHTRSVDGSLTFDVAPVTPTASLSISPTSGSPSTSITYSLSSTNAQSCEIIANGNTILDKSTNQTSMNTTTTEAVGVYNFSTRCWSGANGTGTVSATDTDTLTITSVARPALPATFTATAGLCGTNQITIDWSSVPEADSYQVYRSGTLIHDGGGTSKVDGGLTAGASYTYTITTWNAAAGSSSGSKSTSPVSTTAPIACVVAVNGTCGSANGRTYDVNNSVIPVGNRCSSGTYNVGNWGSDAEAWYTTTTFDGNGNGTNTGGAQAAYYLGRFWSCDGSGGGTTRGCTLSYQPRCGSLNGTGPLASVPQSGTALEKRALCDIGTASVVATNPGSYDWNCTNGTGPTAVCSASRPVVVGSAPTATISATGPVAFENQSLWEKAVSFITGRDHVAQASHQNATVNVGENGRITWSSANADSCSVSGNYPGWAGSGLISGTQRFGNMTPAGTYTFTITCSKTGFTDASHSATITVTNPGPPGCPGCGGSGDFITATPGACGTGTITVDWNNEASTTYYEIERDGGAPLSTGSSSIYTHSSLSPGSTHNYRARACNASGCSAWSDIASATAPIACVGSLYSITATAGTGGTIAPSGTENNIPSGSLRSFAITASPGYNIQQVTVNGIPQGAISSLNITVVDNYVILATFVAGPPAGCGDSVVQAGEQCDDGNFWNGTCPGHTCSATCTLNNCAPACGDGNVDSGEECDPGLGSFGNVCPATCTDTCTLNGNVCSGTMTINFPDCPILNGQSKCVAKPSFLTNSAAFDSNRYGLKNRTTNVNTLNTYVTGTYRYNPASGVGSAVELAYGVNTLELWEVTGPFSGPWSFSGSSPVTTFTARAYCSGLDQFIGGICQTPVPVSTLKICEQTASGWFDRAGGSLTPMLTGSTVNLRAVYDTNSDCSGAAGAASWSESVFDAVSLTSAGNDRVVRADRPGTETITVTLGETKSVTVTVSDPPCIPETCASRETQHCSGETFSFSGSCGVVGPCTGTRDCDYNWKEVAPF